MSSMIKKKTITGKLPCKKIELDLGITLKGGQSFRWKEISDKKYIGVFDSNIWTLYQDEKTINFIVHNTTIKTPLEAKKKLEKYFNLHLCLEDNLKDWSKRDDKFSNFTDKVAGVRILNQDPIENVFSFICSANNNIIRITKMIDRLCFNFGDKIDVIDDVEYYDFPKIERLADDSVPDILTKENFGYRAKYIHKTAVKLVELGGIDWLDKLKKSNGEKYDDARLKLRVLSGVGHKVADCICLMSLGHLESIPVDTHVFQVAKQYYLTELNQKCKTKTPSLTVSQEINQYFRDLWGDYAGWAQTVVFCSRITKDDTQKIDKNKKLNDNNNNINEEKSIQKKR
ncbi:N-glycosylase/DNA lyase, partial [Aphidius gifuensis]